MQQLSPKFKRIAIDVLGYLLILAAGLTGWLPGPGGLPLLIIGLSLLATNNEWAARLLLRVKQHGGKLSDRLFSTNKRMQLLVDAIGVALVAIAVVLLSTVTRDIAKTATISLLVSSCLLLLGNRKRMDAIRSFMRRFRTRK